MEVTSKILLHVGEFTTEEFAAWRGISTRTLSNNRSRYLEDLGRHADYHLDDKRHIIIDRVIEEEYQKKENPRVTYNKVLAKVDETWADNGLDTCSRVGYAIWETLRVENEIKEGLSPDTIIRYAREARNVIYGKPFSAGGELGYCVYLWCTKDKNNNINFLTEEETEVKEKLLAKHFKGATEKMVIVKEMVDNKEITKEEGYDILLSGEAGKRVKGNFGNLIEDFKDITGKTLIRGTLVTRMISAF